MAVASAWAVPQMVRAASNPQKVNIALAARHSLYHLPLFLADQLGFVKNDGLQIEWIASLVLRQLKSP